VACFRLLSRLSLVELRKSQSSQSVLQGRMPRANLLGWCTYTCTVLFLSSSAVSILPCVICLFGSISVVTATDWTTGVLFSVGAGIILLFSTVSRPALGPTQPPIQWVPGVLSPGVRRPGRETNHFHLVPRLKLHGTIPSHLYTCSWRRALLRTGCLHDLVLS
jgi:hypothetical protein